MAGMAMASVAAIVEMGVTGMTVVMVVIMTRGMVGHPHYSTRSMAAVQPLQCLLRTMTLCLRE
jgi:hypothetical protein